LGAEVVGIDISEVGITQARKEAKKRGLADKTEFYVMDAEATTFPDNTFDVICVSGVLHHLDRTKAFKEMARILKPTGAAIAAEPLAHNPVIQLYRKMTPHLRTEFEAEHILHAKKDVELARRYFDKIEIKFFHLATIAAVPFRKTPIFNHLLALGEKIDSILLKIPLIQRQAWQMVLTFREPKK
ncbi:class I SAM-dependent methyltransferase, partial [Candidatus Uhrbacteria bacterium]|nr:class I SAM-dependent methyltransferase [Candidatus Uhrbacteria bacterium]